MSKDKVDKYCQAFLDATNRPFDYHPDGRVPDGYPQNTTQLMDYYDMTPFVAPELSAGYGSLDIAGIGFTVLVGLSTISNTMGFVNNGASYTGSPIYGYAFFLLNEAGRIEGISLDLTSKEEKSTEIISSISSEFGVPPSKVSLKNNGKVLPKIEEKEDENLGVTNTVFWTYGTANYNQIFGVSNQAGYDTDGLIANMRVINSGIRLWPTIEVVTDSSTLHVAKYYGCQMTPTQLRRTYDSNTTLYTTMKECPEFFETHNAAGITGRLVVSQEGPLKLTEINALNNWNSTNFSTNNYFMPVVVVQFSTTVTLTDSAEVALPFNFMYRTLIEGVLQMPTPILSTRPPYSHDWCKVLKIMSYESSKFPSIVEGHTFKKVNITKLRQAVNVINGVLSSRMKKKKRRVKPEYKPRLPPPPPRPVVRQIMQEMERDMRYVRPARRNNRARRNGGANFMRNFNNNRLTQEDAMARRRDINITANRPRGQRRFRGRRR